VEFIHQAPGTGKTEAQGARLAEMVAHGQLDIGNARTVVFGDHLDSPFATALNGPDAQLPAPGVFEDVAGELGDGGHDRGTGDWIEADQVCKLAHEQQ